MAIDPRLLKEMLMTQWLSGVSLPGLTAGGSAAGAEDAGLFDLLFTQLLNGDPGADAGVGGTSGSLERMAGLPPANVLALFAGSSAPGGELRPDVGASSAYDGLIREAAAKYGVDASLIKAVVQTESSFRPDAVSTAGAKGLMQLMDDTARSLGVTDAFDARQNIEGGTRFLSYLLRKYDGNTLTALAAYNAGPGRVDRLGLATDEDVVARLAELPEETQAYIGKVLQARSAWTAAL